MVNLAVKQFITQVTAFVVESSLFGVYLMSLIFGFAFLALMTQLPVG